MRKGSWSNVVAIIIVAALVALIVRANRQGGRYAREGARPVESPAAVTLSRDGLQRTIERQRTELRRSSGNARAAVGCRALLRKRVVGADSHWKRSGR
jgi:hypothetical protein